MSVVPPEVRKTQQERKQKARALRRRAFWGALNPIPYLVIGLCIAVIVSGLFPNGWMGTGGLW